MSEFGLDQAAAAVVEGRELSERAKAKAYVDELASRGAYGEIADFAIEQAGRWAAWRGVALAQSRTGIDGDEHIHLMTESSWTESEITFRCMKCNGHVTRKTTAEEAEWIRSRNEAPDDERPWQPPPPSLRMPVVPE